MSGQSAQNSQSNDSGEGEGAISSKNILPSLFIYLSPGGEKQREAAKECDRLSVWQAPSLTLTAEISSQPPNCYTSRCLNATGISESLHISSQVSS